ncbi:hypothetical protein HY492_00400 [Candidatus Woesearchaeota archaeon]|nr:hypothetical protein [Candidatus Woesearchaeota archaeon]
MIDHYQMLNILIALENNASAREDSLVCRVEAAFDHRPLLMHPEFLVAKGTRGCMKTAQLMAPKSEYGEEYLWMQVVWDGIAPKKNHDRVPVHYKRFPDTSIWGDALYLVEDFTLIDIVAKNRTRNKPLQGQNLLRF